MAATRGRPSNSYPRGIFATADNFAFHRSRVPIRLANREVAGRRDCRAKGVPSLPALAICQIQLFQSSDAFVIVETGNANAGTQAGRGFWTGVAATTTGRKLRGSSAIVSRLRKAGISGRSQIFVTNQAAYLAFAEPCSNSLATLQLKRRYWPRKTWIGGHRQFCVLPCRQRRGPPSFQRSQNIGKPANPWIE